MPNVLLKSETYAAVVNFLCIKHGPHLPGVRVRKEAILSPHGALRAYTVLLTAEPRRGSLLMVLIQYQRQTAPRRGASGER